MRGEVRFGLSVLSALVVLAACGPQATERTDFGAPTTAAPESATTSTRDDDKQSAGPRTEFEGPAQYAYLFEGLTVYDSQDRLTRVDNPPVGCDRYDAGRIVEILLLDDVPGGASKYQQYSSETDCTVYVGPDSRQAVTGGGRAEYELIVVSISVMSPLGGFVDSISTLSPESDVVAEGIFGRNASDLTLVEEMAVRQLVSLQQFVREMSLGDGDCPRFTLAPYDQMQYLGCNSIQFNRFYPEGQIRIDIGSQDFPDRVGRLRYDDLLRLIEYVEAQGA